MAAHLCGPCANIVVDKNPQNQSLISIHHDNLSQLRSCAKNPPSPCPVCRLLWASIEQNNSPELLRQLLNDWGTNENLRGARLYLFIHLADQYAYRTECSETLTISWGKSVAQAGISGTLGSVSIFAPFGMLSIPPHSRSFGYSNSHPIVQAHLRPKASADAVSRSLHNLANATMPLRLHRTA
jgi:hypothetical protein